MMHRGTRAALAVLLVLLASFSSGGCRKTEAPQGKGADEGATININALAEIEHYKEILRKDPNNLQALINVGNLYFDTRQDLLAIEHYQRALELDPRNSNVRTDMAVCLRRRGNTDRAIEELKKVIAMDPRHAQSRYNLGIIMIQDRQDVEGGIKIWEALLENIPNYPYKESLKADIARMRGMGGGGGKPKGW